MTKANISMVTLGVRDLAAQTAFYRALGWTLCKGSSDSVTFLDGGCVVLGLFGLDALADDAGLPAARSGFSGVSCAFNRPDRPAVDAYLAQAQAAGATITKPAHETFWGGYGGYFTDPEGHVWEVAHNPFAALDENGRMAMEPIA